MFSFEVPSLLLPTSPSGSAQYGRTVLMEAVINLYVKIKDLFYIYKNETLLDTQYFLFGNRKGGLLEKHIVHRHQFK
jgi:hypothetical protein